MATASHVWAVRDGLRRNAFGWSGIRKTIQRLHEAVDEIERIARTVIWRWQARAQGCCSARVKVVAASVTQLFAEYVEHWQRCRSPRRALD